ELALARELVDRLLVELLAAEERLDLALRLGIVDGRLTGLATDAAGYLGDRGLDRERGLRVERRELLADADGGPLCQLEIMGARDVAAGADRGGEQVVAGRAGDQAAEAGVGEPGAGVAGDRADHLAVAALDQDVGDRLAQRLALGDGQQMLLALAARI